MLHDNTFVIMILQVFLCTATLSAFMNASFLEVYELQNNMVADRIITHTDAHTHTY